MSAVPAARNDPVAPVSVITRSVLTQAEWAAPNARARASTAVSISMSGGQCVATSAASTANAVAADSG
jgi:hypothetical protein